MLNPLHTVTAWVRGIRQDQRKWNTLLFGLASIAVGLTLFLPRPQNFAPIGALGLFAGAHAQSRRAWAFPLSALTVYTIALGGYHWVVLSSVYLGFGMSGIIGKGWLRGRVRPHRVGIGAFCTAAVFFLVSNAGSWLAFGVGRGETLFHHYLLGLPFFWNSLAGDLFFSVVLFGGFALAEARKPSLCLEGAAP